jgi:GNAT superfamily N-acetyltransferase
MSVGIEKLAGHHAVDEFDCGQLRLNLYLQRYALGNQRANAAQTYVGLADKEVIGYFTLAVGSVAFDEAAGRLKAGLAKHPVPIMLLARLAVASAWHGKGVGAGLLRDAALRTLAAADIAGIRALVVHAKDAPAQSFYEHHGFATSPSDSLHLHFLLKDLRRMYTVPGVTRPRTEP